MENRLLALPAAALAVTGSLGLAAPASAAGAPSPNASCVGRVFQPQAVGEPGAVAERIAFIKAVLLPDGVSFGDVINPLARGGCEEG